MEYKLDTSIKNDIITQELFKKEENLKERISTWVLNARERSVRDALIKLGWTPPPDE